MPDRVASGAAFPVMDENPSTRKGGHLLFNAGLLFLLLWTTWVFSGLKTVWLMPSVGVAVLMLLYMTVRAPGTSLWRDPLFYLGLLFLLYLSLQWFNAGRVLFYDVGFREWRYSTPRYPDLPWAIKSADAAQKLAWFFPAWVAVLAVRSPLISGRMIRRDLEVLVYSAGALALLGAVQFATGTRDMYWLTPMKSFFFASFGYPNHAATYFIMVGALAAGLLFRYGFRNSGAHSFRRVALAASLLLCLVGANLCLSRAGTLMSIGLAVVVVIYATQKAARRLPRWHQFQLLVYGALISAIVVMLVVVMGGDQIHREFTGSRKAVVPEGTAHAGPIPVTIELSSRFKMAGYALDMWRDHVWYGVGAWGYRYLAAFYVPKDEWNRYVRAVGKANVHCDPVQFLAEFGLIGAGLIAAALLFLGTGWFARPNPFFETLYWFGLLGVLLVALHSVIDLPFRCPAIIMIWSFLLAGLPKATRFSSAMNASSARPLADMER